MVDAGCPVRTQGGGMVDLGCPCGNAGGGRSAGRSTYERNLVERGDGKRLRLLRRTAPVFQPSHSRLVFRVGWGPLQCKVIG